MRHIATDDLWSKVKALHSKSVGHTQKSQLDTASNEQDIDVAKIEPTITDESNPENPSIEPIHCTNEEQTYLTSNTSELVCTESSSQEQKPDEPSGLCNQVFHPDPAQPLDVLKFPNPPSQVSRQPPSTIDNIRHLLREYGISARYNVIKKKVEVILPSHVGTMENMDNVAMTYIISLATLNGISCRVPEYVEAVADRNAHNPVADWINSKPWDGKDRLPDIYATVISRDDYPLHLKKILVYKWLLSSVAAALKPKGFRARGVLTFQGEQGIGKTSWIMSLVPDAHLRETTVKVDHHLDGSNKDSILGAISHWLVEIGELDSSFKKDIARLKGFLTSDYDKLRRPYARTESEYPRRTVFFASVNQADFLVDNTGNTRWWTIPVSKINFNHAIDMQQLFAQLAEDFQSGKEWWLAPHEEDLLEYCNREHRSVSVIRERLLENVDMELIGKEGNPAMTALEVLTKLGFDKPTNPQCKECAAILRELFGEHKKIKGINKWRIPLRRPTVTSVPITDIDS